jgi:hypothetical protein
MLAEKGFIEVDAGLMTKDYRLLENLKAVGQHAEEEGGVG